MKWVQRAAIFIMMASLTLILFKPFCNAMFHCGCEGFWAGGGKFCNVHVMGVPHCPFCATGNSGAFLPRILILMSQAFVVFMPSRLSLFSRFAFGILAGVFVGTAIGFGFHWWTHYPAFL